MDRRVQPPLRHRPIASGEYRTVEPPDSPMHCMAVVHVVAILADDPYGMAQTGVPSGPQNRYASIN